MPGLFKIYLTRLLTQVHASFFIQLPEPWVFQVLDEADSLAGALHFGAQFLVHIRELVEAEDRFFYCVTFQFVLHFKVLQLGLAQHYLGSNVEVGDTICLGYEWCGAAGARVGFYHEHFAVLDGKLYVDKAAYIEAQGYLLGYVLHFGELQLAQVKGWEQCVAVAAVYTCRLYVLHNAHDVYLLTIAYGIYLGLLAAVQESGL